MARKQIEILFESVGVRKDDERTRTEPEHGVETQRGGENIGAFERMGDCIGRKIGEKEGHFHLPFVVFQSKRLQEGAGSGQYEGSDVNGSESEENEKRVLRVPWKWIKCSLSSQPVNDSPELLWITVIKFIHSFHY